MVLPGTHITPCGGSMPRQQLGALNRNLLALDMLASGVESALQADIRRLGDRLVTWLDSHS